MPTDDGMWGETRYTLDAEPASTPDWLVVYEGWPDGELLTSVPLERRIFLTGEPESFHKYQPKFLAQFGSVITTQRVIRHSGVIHSQVAINWFAGVLFKGPRGPLVPTLSFADFVASNPPKTRLCSVVCSDKAVTRGHRQRLDFVKQLRESLGDQIDFFGRGIRSLGDKDEALADYRYHIALENSSHRDYWSEKLADPFLRGCFPIYSGCPNVADYFPQGSYITIDITKPKQAIAIIASVLQSDIDRTNAQALAEAKRRVLWEHNVFALLERLYPVIETRLGSSAPLPAPALLQTDHYFKDQRLRRRIARYLRQHLNWK